MADALRVLLQAVIGLLFVVLWIVGAVYALELWVAQIQAHPDLVR